MLLVFALAVSFPNDTGLPANAAVAAQTYYSFYTDIALLVLVGLGFLMSFLVKYAYSSLGFTLLLTAFTLQWTILVNKKNSRIRGSLIKKKGGWFFPPSYNRSVFFHSFDVSHAVGWHVWSGCHSHFVWSSCRQAVAVCAACDGVLGSDLLRGQSLHWVHVAASVRLWIFVLCARFWSRVWSFCFHLCVAQIPESRS